MNKLITEINSVEELKQLVSEHDQVLVDFWAAWCGPCRYMSPVLDQLAEDRQGDLAIAKVNVDEQQQLMTMFGIASIPTMVAFKGGQPAAHRIVGAMPRPQLEAQLATALGG